MSTTLRTILYIFMFAGIVVMQYNLDADKTATRQLKNNLELAVHDAGLALSDENLANGKIVFDQDKAIENMKASLDTNLRLSSQAGFIYSPTSDSFFKEDLYVTYIDFIDDSKVSSFPYLYENPDYTISETINGPSIIVVMTTESPHPFAGPGTTIRQTAVYEYKK